MLTRTHENSREFTRTYEHSRVLRSTHEYSRVLTSIHSLSNSLFTGKQLQCLYSTLNMSLAEVNCDQLVYPKQACNTEISLKCKNIQFPCFIPQLSLYVSGIVDTLSATTHRRHRNASFSVLYRRTTNKMTQQRGVQLIIMFWGKGLLYNKMKNYLGQVSNYLG